MNKPLTMIIKETKVRLANICNESGLSPAILDLILQGIYSEVHLLAERQAAEEEMAYVNMLRDKDINNENLNTDEHDDEQE